MPLPNKEHIRFCSKKAFEISYALFRIAHHLAECSRGRSANFAESIEEQGLKLLKCATACDYDGVELASESIQYFLILGNNANLIHQDTVEIVLKEIGVFNSAITELRNSANVMNINLDGIFSQALPAARENEAEEVEEEQVETIVEVPEEPPQEDSARPEKESEVRQSLILDKIRQNENCRMREIQELFPDVSERTIRYHLQNLVERGLVERIGNSGPATHYRIRNLSTAQSL